MDFETTGLSCYEDEIVSWGALLVMDPKDDWKKNVCFESFVRPLTRKIHPKASQVTGITDKTVANQPTLKDVTETFQVWLHHNNPKRVPCTWVGHNAIKFDFPVWVCNLERALHLRTSEVMEFIVNQLGIVACVDLLPWSRTFLTLKKHSLQDVFGEVVGGSIRNVHSALGDCQAVYEICLQLFQKHDQLPLQSFVTSRHSLHSLFTQLESRRRKRNVPQPIRKTIQKRRLPAREEKTTVEPSPNVVVVEEYHCAKCSTITSRYFQHQCFGKKQTKEELKKSRALHIQHLSRACSKASSLHRRVETVMPQAETPLGVEHKLKELAKGLVERPLRVVDVVDLT